MKTDVIKLNPALRYFDRFGIRLILNINRFGKGGDPIHNGTHIFKQAAHFPHDPHRHAIQAQCQTDSNGDGTNYQYLNYSSVKAGVDTRATHLIPMDFPSELSLTKDGLLTGMPMQNYPGIDLVFDITDNNLLNRRKALKFHSYVAGTADHETLRPQDIRLWPNPVRDELNITFSLVNKARLQLELTDPAGKSVLPPVKGEYPAGINNVHVDLSGTELGPGLYFLVIRSGGEVIGIKKVVVM